MFRYKKLANRFGNGVLFFSVPKKCVKLAVNRNKLKRWFRVISYEFFNKNNKQIKNNYVVIYSIAKGEEVSFAIFRTKLIEVLQKLR